MKSTYTAASIYEILKKRIQTLQYEPGTYLNETELGEEFNVSRTPIRQALQKLESERLINIVRRVGAQVTLIDYKLLKSMFEVRRELEALSVKLAVVKMTKEKLKQLQDIVDLYRSFDAETEYEKLITADHDFHAVIREVANNPVLDEMLANLYIHLERFWHYTTREFVSTNLFEHTYVQIIEAIKNKDENAAAMAIMQHIDDYINQLKSDIL